MNKDFNKQLEELFNSEDADLFKPKTKPVAISREDRLTQSFIEITDFVTKNSRLPEIDSEDLSEQILAARLESFRNDTAKAAHLKVVDSNGLLDQPEIPQSIDELFEKDAFGLFATPGRSVLELKNIFLKKQAPRMGSIAERKPAKEFDTFKPLFIEQQNRLETGENILTHFVSVDQITVGGFYIQDGMMLHIADVGNTERKRTRIQQRLRIIYENGVESNMYRRSLAQRLYEGGFVVTDTVNYITPQPPITPEDIKGYVYVLKSKSDKENITSIKNLYKIGFTTTPIIERIKDAHKDPTYLMSHVEVVQSYIITGSYNPQKIEYFIHRIFADAAIELSIIDSRGIEYRPKEWYSVPLHVIEQAINLLQTGEITNYFYSNEEQMMLGMN